MTDELKKRMARLRELAPRLNSATDQASRLVRMVEIFLVEELHIGISAESGAFNSWSPGTDENGRTRMIRQTLAFGRVGTAYRIHVVDELIVADDEAGRHHSVSKQVTPWPSCGRETKLRAVEKLPELLDRIIQETDRLAETAGETAAKIEAMIGDPEVPAALPAGGASDPHLPGMRRKRQVAQRGSGPLVRLHRLRAQVAHRQQPDPVHGKTKAKRSGSATPSSWRAIRPWNRHPTIAGHK